MTTTIRVSHRKHAAPIPEGWRERWHSRLANASVLSLAYWMLVGLGTYCLITSGSMFAPFTILGVGVAVIVYVELVRVFLRRSGY